MLRHLLYLSILALALTGCAATEDLKDPGDSADALSKLSAGDARSATATENTRTDPALALTGRGDSEATTANVDVAGATMTKSATSGGHVQQLFSLSASAGAITDALNESATLTVMRANLKRLMEAEDPDEGAIAAAMAALSAEEKALRSALATSPGGDFSNLSTITGNTFLMINGTGAEPGSTDNQVASVAGAIAPMTEAARIAADKIGQPTLSPSTAEGK